jgi:hypothetical protein
MGCLREMTDEDEVLLSELVSQGMAFLEVRQRMPDLRLHELRSQYTQYRRSARSGLMRPVPDDLAERIKWVQAQWSTHEWSTRWVGRFANKKETDLSMEASQMLQ